MVKWRFAACFAQFCFNVFLLSYLVPVLSVEVVSSSRRLSTEKSLFSSLLCNP